MVTWWAEQDASTLMRQVHHEVTLHVMPGLLHVAYEDMRRRGCPASVCPDYLGPSHKYRGAGEYRWRWWTVEEEV